MTSPKKSLIIVDDVLSARVPALTSLVNALPILAESGWSIEFWGRSLDLELAKVVHHRKTPVFSLSWLPIPPVWNYCIRHVIDGARWLFRSGRSQTVFLSTGGRFFLSDLQIFQFYNKAWFRIQADGVEWGPESSWKRFLSLWGVLVDWLGLSSPTLKVALPASDAIRDEIIDDFPSHNVVTLANAVEVSRFDQDLRKKEGSRLRKEFGYREDETILIFVSQGHYTRKGFWLALKAIKLLRDRGNLRHRLAVLGGSERALQRVRTYLKGFDPAWTEWVDLVGWTDRVPDYMAAADALFFPSYFEAFSLVEIEAAAMGLPLILTRHHGSEMILKDGQNGYFSGFSPEEVGATLEKFDREPLHIDTPITGRSLTTIEFALQFQRELEKILCTKRGE